jgi:hypothetical protein
LARELASREVHDSGPVSTVCERDHHAAAEDLDVVGVGADGKDVDSVR